MRDLMFAARRVWRSKVSSGLAILILAIGIAGATAMFALVQGILLRSLPVRNQDQLLVAWKELRTGGSFAYAFGSAEIDAVGRDARLLQAVAGVESTGVDREVMVEAGRPSYVRVGLVTGGFFEVLGVRPAVGRAFTASDDLDGSEPVLVISHGFWQRQYGRSRDVLGRTLQLGGQGFTIVGVMPPGLDYPHGVDVWRAVHSVPLDRPFGDAARQQLNLLARVRPGVSLAQATGELSVLTRQLDNATPQGVPRDLVVRTRSLQDVIVGDFRTVILALFASVVLLLLIASANVANLLLIQGEARQTEMAIRAALGAGGSRAIREVLAESLFLALAAGSAGVVIAWWGLRLVLAFLPDGVPRAGLVRIEGTVVAFAFATAFVTTVAAGLVSAASSSMHRDIATRLRGGGTGIAGARPQRVRSALVVAQIALAAIVISAAGLLTRSLVHLQTVDTGIAADRLVFVDLSLPSGRDADPARHAQFLAAVTSSLERSPAIAAITPVNVPPFAGEDGWDLPRFTAEGQGFERAAANPELNLESVYPTYFDTLQIAIRRGRAFTKFDRTGSLPVAIVSEDLAASTWPGQDPIGKRLKMGAPSSSAPWLTVVGVAALTRYRDLTRPRPTLYLPAAQFQNTAQMLAVRMRANVGGAPSLIRAAVQRVDPQVLVVRVTPFGDLLAAQLTRPRFDAFLFNAFGLAALLLASVGVFGLLATYVRQRDRELAIRQALGATPGIIRRLVLSEALRLAGIGLAFGLAGAAFSVQALRHLVVGVQPFDPVSLVGTVVLIVTVSVVASVLPARRATRLMIAAMLRGN